MLGGGWVPLSIPKKGWVALSIPSAAELSEDVRAAPAQARRLTRGSVRFARSASNLTASIGRRITGFGMRASMVVSRRPDDFAPGLFGVDSLSTAPRCYLDNVDTSLCKRDADEREAAPSVRSFVSAPAYFNEACLWVDGGYASLYAAHRPSCADDRTFTFPVRKT